MDWASIDETIKVAGSLATAAAACFAATIAYRGLSKWRTEAIGKRRAELAEATLADFYRIQEIYQAARGAFISVSEMQPLDGVSDELATDSHYAPLRRIREHEEFLGKFRARKYEFAALFGKEAAAPFDEIRKVHNEIVGAVEESFRHKEIRGSRRPEDVKYYKELRQVIFSTPAPGKDDIAHRMNRAVENIEMTCRPEIEAMVKELKKS